MPDNVTINTTTGTGEMFSGRGILPWHQSMTNSKIVTGLLTASEAIIAAQLGWKVEAVQLSFADTGALLPFPSHENTDGCFQGIRREDNGFALGVLKGRYHIIQNHEAFEFFDSIVADGKAVYDTAGSLDGGRKLWLLAKLDGEFKVNGDKCERYALLVTTHDGTGTMQVCFVTVRVVCANTLSIALSKATNVCKVRHCKNWQDKKAQAAKVLGFEKEYFADVQNALTKLSETLLTPEQMRVFTETLIPAKDEKDVATRTQNIRDEINRLFGKGAGNAGATRWDALNAVTDYVDHSQSLRGGNRLSSAILSNVGGARLKQVAFDTLTNDELMTSLMAKSFTPATSIVIGGEFARLLDK